MKPLIKICGIQDLQILHELLRIDEVNFIGFIFYGLEYFSIKIVSLLAIKGEHFRL